MSEPTPETQHALEDRVKVWNVTIKSLHLPNGQWIMAKSSTEVRGWAVWKDHDVVKAWLNTGALTETDPEAAPPPGEVMEKFTSFPDAPSVFTGKIEPLRVPGSLSGSPPAPGEPNQPTQPLEGTQNPGPGF